MKPALFLLAALLAAPLRADEGMWTFDNPPEDQLFERYGFVPTASWLEHARLASLRFSDGGSGSFVSPDGLALTNHHVAVGQLQKMSSPKKDFVKDGFYAKSRSEEIPCPDLEINQLVSYEDATERVMAAIPKDVPPAAANEKRKAAIAALEKDCTDKTGLRCDVVELYQGGEYWVYRYKKYTDVRLVMAPEKQAAFFGGDPDNFTYPRFDLDYAFFRVYEGGKPARPARFFPFKGAGPSEGELVFVTGHPGSTSRLLTAAQLAFERDLAMPVSLKSMRRSRAALEAWSAKGPEQARQAGNSLFGVENGLKVRSGEWEGLSEPKFFAKKEAEESDLRSRVAADPALQKAYGDAWEKMAAAVKAYGADYKRHRIYTGSRYRAHSLAPAAETIVRWVAEAEKPNGDRYAEFRDSALESLRWRLFSPAPTYPEMEEFLLADRLREYVEELGADDPFVKALLDGKTAEEAAAAAVRGTKMGAPAFRKALVEGGRKAVAASDDPLIAFARRADPFYRQMRDWYEDDIESVETEASERIARARFAVYGKSTYPDATFTLRLAFGKAAGYEQGKTLVPYKTVFSGLFARSDSFDGKAPFDLPPLAAASRGKVDMKAPLNFVSSNDITGGNSGSPVIDKDLRLVGLIFDGNVESFPNEYLYSEERGRAVSVHAGGILESLRSIYPMPALLKELESAAADAAGDHSMHH
ncbi:MAG: S46 family peptidase [Elusimicrobia bacterium]|nr:S46 family peptidase [Elusimicrobiota bacterium]